MFLKMSYLILHLDEFQADGFRGFDGLAGVGQQAGRSVAGEHLDFVGVAAGYEQILAVGRQDEIARMDACGLVAGFGQRAVLGVDVENGQPVAFQAVGGIEVAAVRRKVDVGTSAGVQRVGLDGLHQCQAVTVVSESQYFARELCYQVSKPSVGGKLGVAWAGTGSQEDVRSLLLVHQRRVAAFLPVVQREAVDAVGTQVVGQQVFAVGGETDKVQMGFGLAFLVGAMTVETDGPSRRSLLQGSVRCDRGRHLGWVGC